MPNPVRPARYQWGVSLIELMVALVIGLFLILGAVTVFNQSRNTYRASESVARLQEVGRLAMDVIETDVRMANFWGMSNRADYIVNRAGAGQFRGLRHDVGAKQLLRAQSRRVHRRLEQLLHPHLRGK
jgi:type IV pilus assembly protein PilW